jgi:N-acetylglucosaminyl-diphospho-decaprenol L-rhamnosyltransferase
MDLSIIILSYKMKRLVRNCLNFLNETDLNLSYEIIVVDNDSNDGIEEMLKADFPNVKFVKSEQNFGMGGGNNLGYKNSTGENILILNPDIYISAEAILKMYNYLQNHKKVGLIGPRLLNPDKSLQYTCYRWHKFFTPLYRRTFLGKLNKYKKQIDEFLMKDFDHQLIKEVDWIQGSCIMLPREVIDKVGFFDESFFMYFEDTDLCRRLWLAGYSVLYYGETSVIHMHMKMSSGGLLNILTNKLTRIHILSWLRYMWKHRKTTL